jgi:hypothetical protein
MRLLGLFRRTPRDAARDDGDDDAGPASAAPAALVRVRELRKRGRPTRGEAELRRRERLERLRERIEEERLRAQLHAVRARRLGGSTSRGGSGGEEVSAPARYFAGMRDALVEFRELAAEFGDFGGVGGAGDDDGPRAPPALSPAVPPKRANPYLWAAIVSLLNGPAAPRVVELFGPTLAPLLAQLAGQTGQLAALSGSLPAGVPTQAAQAQAAQPAPALAAPAATAATAATAAQANQGNPTTPAPNAPPAGGQRGQRGQASDQAAASAQPAAQAAAPVDPVALLVGELLALADQPPATAAQAVAALAQQHAAAGAPQLLQALQQAVNLPAPVVRAVAGRYRGDPQAGALVARLLDAPGYLERLLEAAKAALASQPASAPAPAAPAPAASAAPAPAAPGADGVATAPAGVPGQMGF